MLGKVTSTGPRAPWLVSAALLGLAVSGCAGGDANQTGTADGGDGGGDQAFVIGLSGALTGGDAVLGTTQREGAELAVKQINADGGINGREIELIVEDEANDPSRMAEIAQRFISRDAVDAIVGGTNDGTAQVLAQTAEQAGVPLVIPFANGDQITDGMEWTFQVDVATSTFVERYASCADKLTDKVGIIYDDNAFGQSSRDAALEVLKSAGTEPVAVVPIPNTGTNYGPQLSQLRQSGAEVLIAPISGTNAAQLRKDMTRIGYEPPILGPNSLAFETMIDVGGEFIEGNPIFLDVIDENKPEVVEFQEAFKAEYGEEATSGFELLGYDAVMILAEALKQGEGDKEAVREALEGLADYTAVSGAEGSSISYAADEHRRASPEDLVWRWVEDGTFANAPVGEDGCPDVRQ